MIMIRFVLPLFITAAFLRPAHASSVGILDGWWNFEWSDSFGSIRVADLGGGSILQFSVNTLGNTDLSYLPFTDFGNWSDTLGG